MITNLPKRIRDIMQCVQIKIELGHRASPRAKPTKEGFTHDWTVFVRATDGSNISHFVEKVVFHLHNTFANPRRVVKEPPYYVSEVGYAGFDLPIEIYFKNKDKPQKINYDLFLLVQGPVKYVRCEKLTFLNPTDEFKEKLIKAGGVLVLPPGEAQFAEAKNDKKDVKDDRKKVKEVKNGRKKVKEVKNVRKKVKEVKDDKKEVKAEQSSSSSNSRKQDDKRKVEIKVSPDKEEKSSKCEHSSSKSSCKGENKKKKSSSRNLKSEIKTDPKKPEHRKRSGSPITALDGSMAKKRRESVKHCSIVTAVEYPSLYSDSSSESDDDFLGESRGRDSDMDLDISPTSSTRTSNHIYSKSALQILMDEIEGNSSDDEDDFTDIFNVFMQQKSSAKNSQLVESGKASPALSCKSNSCIAISENSSTFKKPTTPKNSQEKSTTKSVSEKKSESSNISDTRNKTQNCIQPPTKAPNPVTKPQKDENKSSKEKPTSTIDSTYDEANKKEDSPCKVVTENINSSDRALNGEELNNLTELTKSLMGLGLVELSILDKAVQHILSTGQIDLQSNTYDFDLLDFDSNVLS